MRIYQAGVCECGVHESQMGEYFQIETKTCPNCKGLDQYKRVMAAEDGRAEEQVKDKPPVTPRPSDGRRLFLRQMSPLELAARRSPKPPPEPRR